jgi:F-type H+-transporting ATPase subunit k
MVATYNILGRQIGSHYVCFSLRRPIVYSGCCLTSSQLALATLGTTFAIAGFSMRGGEKKEANPKPPINAQSKEEEQFIQ